MSYVAPYIDAAGLTIPLYQDILDYLIEEKKAIYGNDIYLEIDSTDYQELSVFALMIFDSFQTSQLVYNNRAPSTAIGVALDSIIKLNGLARNAASYSTVDLLVTGTAGTVINNGAVIDISGNKWNLPASVTIPIAGSITVTATADEEGGITATAGTVIEIQTPVAGWISVTNAASAVPGVEVETDAALRARQSYSVEIPSLSVIEGINGAILDLDGVLAIKYYENNTGTTDINGIPEHSVAFIVDGGDVDEIASMMVTKMTPGTGYYGSTTVTTYDEYGVQTDVKFSRPIDITIDVEVSITALSGYTYSVSDAIKEAVVEFVTALEIGQDVLWSRVLGSALLAGTINEDYFNLTSVKMAVYGSSPYSLAASDIVIAFNEKAVCETTNITVVVS